MTWKGCSLLMWGTLPVIGLCSCLGETKPWPLTILFLEKELSPWETSGQAQGGSMKSRRTLGTIKWRVWAAVLWPITSCYPLDRPRASLVAQW